MPYLIDGHNLIGQLPDIQLTDPDDEAKLVEKLRAFSARTRKQCTVIFDHGLPGGKSKLSNSAVKVFFAAKPGDADSIMLKRIQNARDPKAWTIVTSDERIINAAKKRGMTILRSMAFAQKLNERAPVISKEENPNVHVTKAEVEEWLRIFGEG